MRGWFCMFTRLSEMTDSAPGQATLPASPSQELANIVPSTARALLGLVELRGFSLERLCRGLGFASEDLLEQDLLLSHQQIRQLILRAQRLLGEPALGLISGIRQTPLTWGVTGLAMLTCETLGEAIEYGLAYQREAGSMVRYLLEPVSDGQVCIEVMPRQFDLQIDAFLIDEAFASAVAVARYLIGPEFHPLRVELCMGKPEHSRIYEEILACPVRFGAAQNRMLLEAHLLNARMPGYDRIMCGLVRRQLSALLSLPEGQHDLVASVKNRMRFDIEQRPRQRELAGLVNMSERSLRRHLEAQNTSYRALQDAARYEKSSDLLAHSTMSIAEIAEAVGYPDARSFRRAFHRWSGMSPSSFRVQCIQ